jgi:hypothetical protein
MEWVSMSVRRTSKCDDTGAGRLRSVIWLVGLAGGLLGFVGCSDGDAETSDAGNRLVGDVSEDTDGTDGGDVATDAGNADTLTCEPGELIECSQENTQSIRECNAEGTGTVPGSCPQSQVCRDAECVEVDCIPGSGRCRDSVAEVCNQAGTDWVEKEECTGNSRCEAGSCLNRCELAAARDSYIGCEYWAVELENHLLYEERESGGDIPEDKLPPFGVVLANTSDQYDAKVSVYKKDGTFARAVPERTVGSDIPITGPERTVHSELVDSNGQRLLGPIPGDKPLQQVPLPKGSMLTLILPNHQIPDGETSLQKTAYRIESSDPVVAYQFNPYCCNYNYTNDASLLMPTSALSGNYMYMSYPVWDSPNREEGDEPESPGITVVATEPNTEVSVDLREPVGDGRSYEDIVYPATSDEISGPDEDGDITVTMEEHEVLNIAGRGVGEDLTGARIEASKPVSTFGSHSCTFVPFSRWACDHLESQLQPMETWGERFTATPLKRRGPEGELTREGTYWKFLAQEDATTIETGLDLSTGPEGVLPAAGEGVPSCEKFATEPSSGVIELDAGESCEFGTQTTFVAEANAPILLGAFLSGQESVGEDVDHAGDPAYFLVPPEVQYRQDYSFLTPETYHVNYVTVTTSSTTDTLMLDGEEIELSSLEHYEKFPDLGVARAHIEVEAGPHRIESDSRSFGIVIYGYDDYVSYAYTGGLDLAKRQDID